MKFKFNGGYGAIRSSKWGIILKSGSQLPENVRAAAKHDTVDQLPDMYCEDGCERSMKMLGELYTGETKDIGE